tara:strand:+ start:470 stop:805 length:336 start_codon:yes stop_codon:yes gene_type:complete
MISILKDYEGQEQNFPKQSPFKLERAFRFKGNEIVVSDWLASEVKKYLPATRKMDRHGRSFANVCVNWYRRRAKNQISYHENRTPPKKVGMVSVRLELLKVMTRRGLVTQL